MGIFKYSLETSGILQVFPDTPNKTSNMRTGTALARCCLLRDLNPALPIGRRLEHVAIRRDFP